MINEQTDRKKRFCIIPMCAGKRFDLVHKFPMDNARAELWRTIINVPGLNNYTIDEIRKKMFICSKHFAKNDYKHIESRSLNKTALPSRFLEVAEDYENQSNDVDEIVQETIDNALLLINSAASVASFHKSNDDSSNKRKYTSFDSSYSPKDNSSLDKSFGKNINLIKLKKKSKKIVKLLHPHSPTTVNHEDIEYVDETSEVITNEDQTILSINQEESPEDEISIIDDHDESFVDEFEDVNQLETIDIQPFDNVGDETSESDAHIQDIVKHTSEPITVSISTEYTTIKTANGSNDLHVNHVWLRDFCRCNECWFIKKRINLLNIPINITPIECSVQEQSLFVNWSDGHQSEYSIQKLCHSVNIISSQLTSILWDNFIQNDFHLLPFKKVKILDYLGNDEIAKEILFGLIEHGIAFIEQVPNNEQTTEAVVKRLFSIERTHLSRNNDIISFNDNNSNCNVYKIPHTDMCYLKNAVPGLSIIHHLNVLTKNDSTLFVDGFNILNNIKKTNLNTYERLCRTNVSHEYGDFHHTSPIITLNSLTQEPEQIRFNPYTQSTMNTLLQTELTDFYNDFNCLKNEIEENAWKIELKPGTMVFINNWRILHGYQSLINDRSNIIGCYVSHDEFLSVCRKFNIIS